MAKAEPAAAPSPNLNQHGEQTPPTHPVKRKSWAWLVWLILLCALAVLGYVVVRRVVSGQKATTNRRAFGQGAIPVDAVAAWRGNLPIYVDGLLGTVTPLQMVTVHTRVDGELIKVAFDEGQIVHQGDLLAEIDPNPYKAVLEQAQGQLAKDQASLKDAQTNLARYKQAPEAYTQQQIDDQQATVDQDQGLVKSDQGAVFSAQVNLDYCTIRSPVTGRIGLRQVDQGNIVHASDTTGLAVITQLQPITVIFPIEQNDIPDVVTRSASVPPLKTIALDRDAVLATGKLIAVDSQVSSETATVNLKSQFDNSDNKLFPGAQIKVRLLVNTLTNAVLVPSEAVQIGPNYTFVYVVKSDNTVEIRKVQPGPDQVVNGQDRTAINSGLSPGELVVTNGVDKLEGGTKVDVTRSSTTQPTASNSTTRPSGHRQRSSSPRNSS
jgi:membrane fusion protein, multidrug efflux system